MSAPAISADILEAALAVVRTYPMVERDQLAAIARAILAERERSRWMPIETAPKMQVVILFAVTDVEDGVVKNWKMGSGCFLTGHDAWEWQGRVLKSYDHHPTHWQPLPRPPVSPSLPSSQVVKTPDDASLPSSGGQSPAPQEAQT